MFVSNATATLISGHPGCAAPCAAAPASRRGFTLVEVLLALAVMVVMFTLIAKALGTASLLRRDVVTQSTARLGVRNSMSLLASMRVPQQQYEGMCAHWPVERGMIPVPTVGSFPNRTTTSLWDSSELLLTKNVDNEVFCLIGGNRWYWQGFTNGSPVSSMNPFLDVNENGKCGQYGGLNDPGDFTDFPMGRIHPLHKRPGVATWMNTDDFAYPTFVANPIERDYLCCHLVTDVNMDRLNRNFKIIGLGLKGGRGTWDENDNPAFYVPGSRLFNMTTITNLTDPSHGKGYKNDNIGSADWSWSGSCTCMSTKEDPITGLTRSTVTSLPMVWRLPSNIYDLSKSEINIAYPDAATGSKITWAAANRRLQVGDMVVSEPLGERFVITALRPHPKTDYQTVNGLSVPMIDIATVYPPINATALLPDDDFSYPNFGTQLAGVYFAPRPTEGGASPLLVVETRAGNDIVQPNLNY